MKKHSLFVVLFSVFFILILVSLFFVARGNVFKVKKSTPDNQVSIQSQSMPNSLENNSSEPQPKSPYQLPKNKEEAVSDLEESIVDLTIVSAETTIDSAEGVVGEFTDKELKAVEESLNKTPESTIDSIEQTVDSFFDQLNLN